MLVEKEEKTFIIIIIDIACHEDDRLVDKKDVKQKNYDSLKWEVCKLSS